MRNVVFEKAGGENFCCFKDPIELVFENNKIIVKSNNAIHELNEILNTYSKVYTEYTN